MKTKTLQAVLGWIVLAAMLCGCGFLIMLLATGCAHTVPGLQREQAIYSASTNGLSWLHRDIVPLVPTPYRDIVDGLIAAGGTALGAWNLHQQREMRRIKALALNSASVVHSPGKV